AEVAELVRPHGEQLLRLGGGAAKDAGRLADLARLLTLSGIGMGVAGSTAPASGMEHAGSHLPEMAAPATGSPDNLHGGQGGVAAATWAHVRERIADGGAGRSGGSGRLGRPARLPDPDVVGARIRAAFDRLDPTGAMAAECLADYSAKLSRLASAGDPLAPLRTAWTDCESAFARMLTSPDELAAGLAAAGLPVRFADLPAPVDDEQARWAVANSALQRRRFGVADLAMLLGLWEDDDVEAVLAAANKAAAAATDRVANGSAASGERN